jgi:hypothetical protein
MNLPSLVRFCSLEPFRTVAVLQYHNLKSQVYGTVMKSVPPEITSVLNRQEKVF